VRATATCRRQLDVDFVLASGAGARSRLSLGTAVAGGMLVFAIVGVFLIPLPYAAIELVASRRKRAVAGVEGEATT
jgi:multidrug efflux pump